MSTAVSEAQKMGGNPIRWRDRNYPLYSIEVPDDLIDLIGSKGRAIGSDILEGKRTLLVIHALQQAASSERSRLLRILNKPCTANTAAEVRWGLKLYEKTGAIEYADQTAEQLVEQACAHFVRFLKVKQSIGC
jgi:geranylgeranyl pyrophosphate synthase